MVINSEYSLKVAAEFDSMLSLPATRVGGTQKT